MMTQPLSCQQLTALLLTSRFEYWAEFEGKGIVFGVKGVSQPHLYQQAMSEALETLRFLGYRAKFLKPSSAIHPYMAHTKVNF